MIESASPSVISGFRETTLSSWQALSSAAHTGSLLAILAKIYALLPPSPNIATPADLTTSLASPAHVITHLLHLSGEGYILPHVDNIEASAGTIVGVCLGSTRELVLNRQVPANTVAPAGNEWEAVEIKIKLEPGCAYMQRYENGLVLKLVFELSQNEL